NLDATEDRDRDRNTVTTLNTSDLNGDHQTDLIASNGVILFNTAAGPNRLPTVNAGPDQTFDNWFDFHIRAVATDADQALLTYTWTDSADQATGPRPPVPDACISVNKWGAPTFTVVVDDGHGHRTSDSATYTFVSPNPPTVSVTAPAAGAVVSADSPLTI